MNLAVVYPISKDVEAKKVTKPSKKIDGKTVHPIFPDEKKHYEIILNSHFPMSFHLQDLDEISCRITEQMDDWSLYTFTIAWHLLLAFRCEGKLILNMFITPCEASNDVRSLMELTKISDKRTFRSAFLPIGVTYRSTSLYNAKKGDKFDGKLFLCIQGNDHVRTKFMLNLDVAEILGKSIGVLPYTLRKKKGNSFTVLNEYKNPYK